MSRRAEWNSELPTQSPGTLHTRLLPFKGDTAEQQSLGTESRSPALHLVTSGAVSASRARFLPGQDWREAPVSAAWKSFVHREVPPKGQAPPFSPGPGRPARQGCRSPTLELLIYSRNKLLTRSSDCDIIWGQFTLSFLVCLLRYKQL